MKYRPRIYYTEGQKALMWERWREGESLQQNANPPAASPSLNDRFPAYRETASGTLRPTNA